MHFKTFYWIIYKVHFALVLCMTRFLLLFNSKVPLPFPKSIVARSRITQGMDGDTTSTLKIVSSSRSTPSSSAKGKPHAPRLDPDGSPASNIDSPPDSTPASARARSSSRSSKAISYEIRGSSDEGKSETDEDDGRPKNTTPSVRRPSSKKTKNSPPVLEIFDDGDEDDNDDNDVQLLSATNTLKSKAAQKKPTPRKKGATKQASIASTEDVDSDDAFDPGESVATTSTFSSASRRPGRSTRKAITYTENDSEDNDDEEEDDSSHGADSDDDLSSTKRTILSGSSSSKRNVVDRQAAPKSTAGSSVSADSGSKKAWSPQIKKRYSEYVIALKPVKPTCQCILKSCHLLSVLGTAYIVCHCTYKVEARQQNSRVSELNR